MKQCDSVPQSTPTAAQLTRVQEAHGQAPCETNGQKSANDTSSDAAGSSKAPHVRRFRTGNGYTTEGFRSRFLHQQLAQQKMSQEEVRKPVVTSLVASPDTTDRVYFWQLYSILGPKRIENVVRNFYTRIFEDPEDWFRRAFSDLAPVEHHVWTQAAMWSDVMGGGRLYHGGEYRLHFHHHHNAMQVMTRRGAERWVGHMLATLRDEALDLSTEKDRVLPALLEFLAFALDKYANEFNFTSCSLIPQTL